jgi:hypothetical protein
MTWVFVTRQLLANGNELMIIPAVANLVPRSKIQRCMYMLSDVVYYSARYAVARYLF